MAKRSFSSFIVKTISVALFLGINLYKDEKIVAYTCVNKIGDAHLPPALGKYYLKEIIVDTEKDVRGNWCKMRGALELMEAGFSSIMYFDADLALDLEGLQRRHSSKRLSFPLHAADAELIKTNIFILRNTKFNVEILSKWYEKRLTFYHDQVAMNGMIRNFTVKPTTFDPTGLEVAHCSHDLGKRRKECWDVLNSYRWNHELILGIIQLSKQLFTPLLLMSPILGIPLPNIARMGKIHELNPISWATLMFTLSRILTIEFVEDMGLLQMYQRNFTKTIVPFVYAIEDLEFYAIPGIGMIGVLTFLKSLLKNFVTCALGVSVTYAAQEYGKRIALPFFYPSLLHVLAYSQNMKESSSNLVGTGRWLSLHEKNMTKSIGLVEDLPKGDRYSDWKGVM